MSTVNFLPLRREDPALLRGEGCFTSNIDAPQALHAAFVRSPLAHGAIRSIEIGAAAEGVVAVLTAQTLTDDGRAVYMPAPNPLLPIAQLPPMEPLARDRVVYVGQPVALVLAHTLAQAQQAADRVQLQLEPLQALPDFGEESPITQVHHRQGDGAQPTDLAPALSVELAMEVPRVLAMSMEPRGMLAIWQGPLGEQGEAHHHPVRQGGGPSGLPHQAQVGDMAEDHQQEPEAVGPSILGKPDPNGRHGRKRS
jgi:carbon-monoxide dehydrogenase large subunit